MIVNQGIRRHGDPANVFLVVLVLTPITQNQQPVKSALQESMQNAQDQRLAI
jgi:hypothetical protein